MITIVLRTLIIYLLLIGIMRFMGKRQLGELEVSELVTTLLLSEIASLPITNQDIPMSHALLPILLLMSLEVLLSGAVMKIPFVKKLLSIRPAVLVRDGKPDRHAMSTARISADELMSQLRQKDISDPDELAYAILEPNGQISIVKKASARQATTKELGLNPPEVGFMHLIIADGKKNDRNLQMAGLDDKWLANTLRKRGLTEDKVFLLLADDSGKARIFPKEAS